jgi:hypothetical protein
VGLPGPRGIAKKRLYGRKSSAGALGAAMQVVVIRRVAIASPGMRIQPRFFDARLDVGEKVATFLRPADGQKARCGRSFAYWVASKSSV